MKEYHVLVQKGNFVFDINIYIYQNENDQNKNSLKKEKHCSASQIILQRTFRYQRDKGQDIARSYDDLTCSMKRQKNQNVKKRYQIVVQRLHADSRQSVSVTTSFLLVLLNRFMRVLKDVDMISEF